MAVGIFLRAQSGIALPALPAINTNNIILATNAAYGATGDNRTDNTTAIQNAINAAASGGTTNGLTGGTVEIPAGTNAFLCGPISLKSCVNLQIDAGAVLRMLPFGQYPGTYAISGSSTNNAVVNANFISCSFGVTNLEISGAGAIDGQGLPWWPYAYTNGAVRPSMIELYGFNRLLIQNLTLSNSPEFHINLGTCSNITIQGITIQAPSSEANPPSHNTDGCDVSGGHILVQNCNISDGDDDIGTMGGTFDVLITNITVGAGHGISIGSRCNGGISDFTVINCTFNGTDLGVDLRSDNDRGGLIQNISYYNLSMTNIGHAAVSIMSYYDSQGGWPHNITPYMACTQAVAAVSSLTPAYSNIIFSNITANVTGRSYPIGMIWARTEMPATNIIFNKVNITGNSDAQSFYLYNVSGAQFIDSSFNPASASPSGIYTHTMFNAEVIITNSAPTNTWFSFDGITTNGYGSTLALYNAQAGLKNTNALDDGPLTLSASTFTVTNNLALFPTTVFNYTLGADAATVAVLGNLALGGTNNIVAGSGFTNGTYTLLTYTGALSGNAPVLGSVPAHYAYSFDTNTARLVKLVVSLPGPPAPANLAATATNLLINLKWNSVGGANSYNLKRGTTNGGPYPALFGGLTATNYADANVTNAMNYFYVVTAVGSGGESSNSWQATAVPLPSGQPTNLLWHFIGNQLQLFWPQDHLGWRLQIQTNALSRGLWTNWATVPNSTNIMATNIMISRTNGSIFLRLAYP